MKLLEVALLGLLMAFVQVARAVDPPSPPDYGISVKDARIAMPDGVQLAADLWMPVGGGAADERFPVLLEYLPYRKNEGRGDRYPSIPISFSAAISSRASISAAPARARAS